MGGPLPRETQTRRDPIAAEQGWDCTCMAPRNLSLARGYLSEGLNGGPVRVDYSFFVAENHGIVGDGRIATIRSNSSKRMFSKLRR
jgi:hypothetical protein